MAENDRFNPIKLNNFYCSDCLSILEILRVMIRRASPLSSSRQLQILHDPFGSSKDPLVSPVSDLLAAEGAVHELE